MSQKTTPIKNAQAVTESYLHADRASTLLNPFAKLDMFAMFNRLHPQIAKWSDLFFNKSEWETDFHAEYFHTALFQHFYFESKNCLKLTGVQPFGFGFPHIFDTNLKGDSVVAPLFIWHLNLRPHPTRPESWVISQSTDSPIAINDYLLTHFKEKYDEDLNASFISFLQKKPLTSAELSNFCTSLAEKIGFQNLNLNAGLREMPPSDITRKLALQGDIAWCGNVGLYPHQKGSLLEKNLNTKALENFTWTTEHTHEFTALPEDANQRAALRTVLRHKITVVEGAHGTGKTHLAVNILLNALSNGQKTAVIAPNLSSLKYIQNELTKLGIGNLAFLLKDLLHDKKLLLDVVRGEQTTKIPAFDAEAYNITLKQARRLLAKSDESHQALSQPIFGNNNFSAVVGMYLKSQRIEGRELLANHLNAADYEFTETEFEQLSSLLEQSSSLFGAVGTLRHPLTQLNASVFGVENPAEPKDFVAQKLDNFIGDFKSLHHKYIGTYDAYSQKLMLHYESHAELLRAQLRQLKESYSDFQFQFGDAFETTNVFRIGSMRAVSLFNSRSKNILSAKDEAVRQYDELKKIHREKKYFQHVFLSEAESRDAKKMRANLESFELSLKGWRRTMPAVIHEELQRLNSKTAQYFDPSLAEDIKKLELQLDAHLVKLNESSVFSEQLQHKMLTLPKRLHFLEETIEKLEETKLHLRDFDAFYGWQKFWLNLPEKSRRLTQALLKVKPKNWQVAFESWYLYNVLLMHYDSSALANDELMRQMNDTEDRLRRLIPTQIAHLWHKKKLEALQQLKTQEPEQYKLIFSNKNQVLASRIFLRDILKKNIHSFTDVYPVLLLTPEVATQIVESEGKEFDLVIFCNAENLSPEDVLPIFQNTDSAVVLTEYSESEGLLASSLAAELKTRGAASIRLNYLHRPLGEIARRLNQTVFYPKLDIPFLSKPIEQTLRIVHTTDGKIQKGINIKELEAVVEILKQISITPFNTYPHVGVVCSTVEQRNALSAMLLQIVQKAQTGFEKIEHLQRNGLGIYTFKEAANMPFDTLIVSGTFTEISDFEISKTEIRQLLNSFSQELYWVNSVGLDALKTAAKDTKMAENAFLVANIILIADTQDASKREEILDRLAKTYNFSPKEIQSGFVKEAITELSHFIQAEYLAPNFTIENKRFPLAILPKFPNQPPVVVRIDGSLNPDAPYFNAAWERRTLFELEKSGIPTLSVWTYNWWRDPKNEAFKLAQRIFLEDKKFQPLPPPTAPDIENSETEEIQS
jgi:RecA/RadA recombinase